jgi:hypothetical protein
VFLTLSAYEFQMKLVALAEDDDQKVLKYRSKITLHAENFDRWRRVETALVALTKSLDGLDAADHDRLLQERQDVATNLAALGLLPLPDERAQETAPQPLEVQQAGPPLGTALAAEGAGEDDGQVQDRLELIFKEHDAFYDTQKEVIIAVAMSAANREGFGGKTRAAESAEDERVRQFVSQLVRFSYLAPLTAGIIEPARLALLPDWVLPLLVTVLMGALGSVIYLLKTMISDRINQWCAETSSGTGNQSGRPDAPVAGPSPGTARRSGHSHDRPFSWFVFRPLLGVVTALAVFVVAKSGLAIADAADATVNPYLMAVVALLAGLMSWQMLATIERWGERFLGGGQTARWAYGLGWALDARAEKDPEVETRLAEELGVSMNLLADWIAQKRPVAPPQQDAIRRFMDMDERLLFSDQPPWSVESTGRREAEAARTGRAG